MKKIFLALLLISSLAVSAQWNNSWIDYSKTYYKFQLANDTLTRIPQSVLAGLGLDAVNADHFQLWRNGQEVRLYTSVSGAVLPGGGYIEFWGEKNDGKPDKVLYRNPDFQLADKYSLVYDTASYFLTVNTAGNNLRFTDEVNGTPANPTPDPFYMRKIVVNFRNNLNRGWAHDAGEYVYSSSYDQGEGWTSPNITSAGSLSQPLNNLNQYTAGPPNSLTVWANIAGNAPNIRSVRIRLNANVITEIPIAGFNYNKVLMPDLPLSLLGNNPNATLFVQNLFATTTDRIVVGSMGITYPSTFNFNASKNFYFELPAAGGGNHLQISNFNFGVVPPVLYDLTLGKRYVGDITSVPGKIRFALPASAEPLRKFILVNEEANNIYNVTQATARNFVNYNNIDQQGDYAIVTSSALFNDGNGNNYVEQYRAYRASANGGSFNAKIYDINEITDQFGYGIKGHPDGLRNFILYSEQQFQIKPQYIFVIGRGVSYYDYRSQNLDSDPRLPLMDIVPTYGWPASDILLTCPPGTTAPVVPIGRLAAINGAEVNVYLQKMQEYETAQRTASCNIEDKAWMKNVLHVVGGKDSSENALFGQYMYNYETIIEDTLFGGHVETFTKTSSSVIQEANSQRILELFDQGLSYIGYFGHSSATTFEFNLSNPENYHNPGKYPFFHASGCNAGNYYTFDPLRLSGANFTLSEKYVLTPERGSIGFLADTHFGVPPFLDFYNRAFYRAFSNNMYGNTVGKQLDHVISGLYSPGNDFLTRVHLEEITLHGDPALKINNFNKPDFVVEDNLVKTKPSIISVADVSFEIDVKMMNIGRATGDSIKVSVKRKLPSGTIVNLYDSLVPGTRYIDSLKFPIVISPTTDKGLNQVIVSLDYTSRVDELCETNNTITKDFYIFEDELRPSSPYNYSIVNQQNITYVANTANPLGQMRDYVMEIDTTELFNSAFKKTYNASGSGGIVEFNPSNLTFVDSTVYYWRVATVPTGSGDYIWNGFSFTYLQNSSPGFNQAHYYQKLKSAYSNISLNDARKLQFDFNNTELNISTGNYPPNADPFTFITMGVYPVSDWGNSFNTLQLVVLDGVTGTVIKNALQNGTGLYESSPPAPRFNQFQFPFNSAIDRRKVVRFINAMPANAIIIMYNLINNNTVTNQFAPVWATDATTFGSTDSSLYHVLKNYGFSMLDQFTSNKPFIFKFTKNSPAATYQQIGLSATQVITATLPLTITRVNGLITSPVFGPANEWQYFHWGGAPKESPTKDSIRYKIIGITNSGNETVLMNLDSSSKHVDISSIDAGQYPYVKLQMEQYDSLKGTPYELDYWRLNYLPVPEGAVATNLFFTMTDSVTQGEQVPFEVAFKNISPVAFSDSIKVDLKVIDEANGTHLINVPKLKPLQPNDTAIIRAVIDTRTLSGINTVALDVNPNQDQPEQLHYNNVLYADLFVSADKFNPLLDVTFDAVHILNRDIVASRPNILIKLKDESRFLALQDTALIKVQVRYPDQTLHNYNFGDTMQFIPADLSSGENTASIEFRPYFPDDGEYELIVSGKDVNGNQAGYLNYRVLFNVINKPMISNLLNYPNPFTTSTAFVFTITGSQVPQNLRIQILTITGKVVKEITKEELGSIHVGNNITDYKWDGTDMYGQKLANGVYLYRVITNLNGKKLDKYSGTNSNGDVISEGVNSTDKYFNKGYGKMYLLR